MYDIIIMSLIGYFVTGRQNSFNSNNHFNAITQVVTRYDRRVRVCFTALHKGIINALPDDNIIVYRSAR